MKEKVRPQQHLKKAPEKPHQHLRKAKPGKEEGEL